MNYRVIKGFEEYKVSDIGTVLSKAGKEMKLQLNQDGYYQVHLHANGKRSLKRVNRLVSEAFLPNPENLPQVDHINGNRDDNHLDNLEWVTAKENKVRSTTLFPERHKQKATITYEQAHQICQYIQDGLRNCDIVPKFEDISMEIIKHIRNGDTWVEVSKDYSLQRSVRAISDETVTWVCYRILDGWANKRILAGSVCPNLKKHSIKRIRAKTSHKHITQILLK